MLVATRDPVPSPGAHEHSSRPLAPRSSRFMTAMQIAGSVLAIPVGLGSAYSVYRANFSVDTTCQTLRANIIAMIDKKIDATARRMLVRHDVETFENTCATVDPDAAAAFKTLLAEPPAHVAAPAAKRVGPKAEPKAEPKSEAKSEVKSDAKTGPARDVRKPELRTAVPVEPAREPAKPRGREAREPVKDGAKESAKAPARETNKAAEAAAEQHDAATDARWLDAVRGALVAHEKTADAPAAAMPVRGAPPHPLAVMPAAPAAPAAEAAPASAPAAPAAEPTPVATALPPPTQVAEPAPPDADVQQPADPDRPVPPASIPEPSGPKPDGWLSKVPFVGQVLAK